MKVLILRMGIEDGKKADLGDVDREAARKIFMSLYDGDWKGKEGRKRKREVMRETIRLSNVYPDLYEEVLKHFDLPVEEWRDFKGFMDKRRHEVNPENP